jgi:uncharacterized protein with PQ loop repeat
VNIGTELIGWSAAAILLLTLARQVYTQWRDHTSKGVSRWLFVGQCAASTGFIVYSWLVSNWVFVVTNCAHSGHRHRRRNHLLAQRESGAEVVLIPPQG